MEVLFCRNYPGNVVELLWGIHCGDPLAGTPLQGDLSGRPKGPPQMAPQTIPTRNSRPPHKKFHDSPRTVPGYWDPKVAEVFRDYLGTVVELLWGIPWEDPLGVPVTDIIKGVCLWHQLASTHKGSADSQPVSHTQLRIEHNFGEGALRRCGDWVLVLLCLRGEWSTRT